MNADVVIIGSGPAGLQAAIHSSRKKVDTVLIGKPANSAIHSAHVENYFGIGGTVEGSNLLHISVEQARSFGCKIIEQNVIDSSVSSDIFRIITESGDVIEAKAVVIATGISRVKLNIAGEKEFLGKGVSYCASCDCNFYKGVPVAVIGNESEAALSAALMTGYASKVYWISDKPDADPTLLSNAKEAGVEMLYVPATEIRGNGNVSSLLLKNGTELHVNGVFIELGGRSSENIAMDLGVFPEIDNTIRVNNKCETTVKGIFACGDITGKPWQVAKAVGEGAIAGINAADYAKGSR